jgi:predicted MFS family arabinose efflux permease
LTPKLLRLDASTSQVWSNFPATACCQPCVKPRPYATLPLSSSLARLLPIEDTTQPGTPAAVWARFAAVSRSAGIWHILGANALYQAAAFGLFTYLAAFLIRTYGMRTGATAFPLALALLGAVLGRCSAVPWQGESGALRGSPVLWELAVCSLASPLW